MTLLATTQPMSPDAVEIPGDHVIVLFGATGDPGKHKPLPGLFHLAVSGLLPERYRSRRLVLFAVAGLALLAPSAAMAAQARPAPAIVVKDKAFGRILARRDHRALYYWTVEKRAGGKIRCTGSCARLWPPLVVRSAKDVPRRIPGSKGTFGVVRRPDGRLQVTYDGLAVYTYVHEGPNQVRCDNVEGWFVVRL
jgi:predicted lipoprotein with Yx(FWY)xxD motif